MNTIRVPILTLLNAAIKAIEEGLLPDAEPANGIDDYGITRVRSDLYVDLQNAREDVLCEDGQVAFDGWTVEVPTTTD